MNTGTVKFFNVDKQFGFITRGGADLHFGGKILVHGYLPRPGDVVEFEVGRNERGETASSVRPASVGAKSASATMVVEMSGGAVTSSGSCVIICGLEGEPLPALEAPTRGSGKGSYATLRVGRHIQVLGSWYKGSPTQIIVKEVAPQVEGEPIAEVLWEGIAAELPDSLSHLWQAVEAANVKAACYHCHELHFPVANAAELGAWV